MRHGQGPVSMQAEPTTRLANPAMPQPGFRPRPGGARRRTMQPCLTRSP